MRQSHLREVIQQLMQHLQWTGVEGCSFLSITRHDNERTNIMMASSPASLPANFKVLVICTAQCECDRFGGDAMWFVAPLFTFTICCQEVTNDLPNHI